MSNVTIDLSPVINRISGVADQVEHVSRQVIAVSTMQQGTDTSLKQLWDEFRTFVESDRRGKQLQLAETRLIKVRQELEQRFGHHAEVRRLATGILQAADLAVVRQETIRSLCEQVMLKAPGYWLPPALLALSGWFSDDQAQATRALAEAQSRDDDKASLFFALIARRAGRQEAAAAWLARFLQIQDPAALDREVIVMIDAMANGVFGPAAQATGFAAINHWLADLQARPGFAADQRMRWTAALEALAPGVPVTEFPLLRQACSSWPAMADALCRARRHDPALAHFARIFDGPLAPPPTLIAAIDQTLVSLVGNFDPEEIPLRRDARRFDLIIDEEGDSVRAAARLAAEAETHHQRTDFAVLLTGAAMRPEVVHASRGTQRLAVALSKSWIEEANADLTAVDRAAVPQRIELGAGTWRATTTDGTDEKAQCDNLERHYAGRIAEAIAKIPSGLKAVDFAGCGFGAFLGIMGTMAGVDGNMSPGVVLVMFIGVCFLIFFGLRLLLARSSAVAARSKIRDELTAEQSEATRLLKGLCAEIVLWRRALTATNPAAEAHAAYLATLSSQDHLATRDGERRIL